MFLEATTPNALFPTALCFLCSFAMGSIPVGYLVGRSKGIDVRSVGSGNVGATNVRRAAGKSAGLITLLGDILKGFASAALPILVISRPDLSPWCALCAVLGHCYSPFLKFRGGKGVATGVGAFALAAPLPTLLATLTFMVVMLTSRFVSLASIVAAMTLPISCALLQLPISISLCAALTSAVIVFRHTPNLKRLMAGTELRRERKRRSS